MSADTRRVDFVSGINGRSYSISLAIPARVPPEEGFRIIYVLDSYFYFASVVEAVRACWNMPPVVVAGIGYPDIALADYTPLRTYDLTLPAGDEILGEQNIAGLFSPRTCEVGGLDEFLATLRTEVIPRVADFARVDESNQTIFGHSLGGLAVLHALFTDPGRFRTFIAASPSIWWGRCAVLAGESQFAATLSRGSVSPRVLICMGGAEGVAPNLPPELGIDAASVARVVAGQRMLENAGELHVRLRSLQGPPAYEVADYVVFPGCNHSLSPWPAIASGLQFAFDFAAKAI